jgi:hypothetical protein
VLDPVLLGIKGQQEGPNYTMAGVKTHQRNKSRGPGRNPIHNRLFPPRKATGPPPRAGGGRDRIQFLVPITGEFPPVSLS